VDELSISSRKSVFATPWFELVGKTVGTDPALHYAISTQDYVSIFAVTRDGTFPLVRQFRPAVEGFTLEIPSGHVDEGETPEQAAKRELREETGFVANEMILLGSLAPDTGRLGNLLWCFFAPRVELSRPDDFKPQPDIEPFVYNQSLRNLILSEPDFSSALNRATILMAVASGHIEL
jgi:ADP-ribose pyrophosphatase